MIGDIFILNFQYFLSLNDTIVFFEPLPPKSQYSVPMIRPALVLLILASLLSACASPVPDDRAWLSPDHSSWIHMETVPVPPGSDALLPTRRLILHQRWSPTGQVLIEGLDDLCGTDVQWQDDQDLSLHLSLGDAAKLRVKDGDDWHGITLHVALTLDRVPVQSWSPDGARLLVIINKCDTGDWNLYLRRRGDPLFNAAMEDGWDDPDVFGGFGDSQKPIALKWTGPRNAEIDIPGKRYQVTLRDRIGDVSVKWRFKPAYHVPEGPTAQAPRLRNPLNRPSPLLRPTLPH